MTRATSSEAWQRMRDTGLLRGQLVDILEHVIDHGPGTAAEILKGTKYSKNLNLSRARFTELLDRGLIREIDSRVCTISGRSALVFEATGRDKPLQVAKRSKGTKAEWRDLAERMQKYIAGETGSTAFAASIAELGGDA